MEELLEITISFVLRADSANLNPSLLYPPVYNLLRHFDVKVQRTVFDLSGERMSLAMTILANLISLFKSNQKPPKKVVDLQIF